MMDYPRENRFLIALLRNSIISMKVYCSRRSDRAVKFLDNSPQIRHMQHLLELNLIIHSP